MLFMLRDGNIINVVFKDGKSNSGKVQNVKKDEAFYSKRGQAVIIANAK